METKGPSLHVAGPSGDVTQSVDEESRVDEPLISADDLDSAITEKFLVLPTLYQAALLSLLQVIFVVLSLCVALLCLLRFDQEAVCKSVFGSVKEESAIVFGKVCLWLLLLLFTWSMKHHHSRARSQGYLSVYRRMQHLKHLPLTIHSTGNVLLLLSLVSGLSQTVFVYILISVLCVELLVTLLFLIHYIVRVMQFNSAKPAPDVIQEVRLYGGSSTVTPTETGFRGGSRLEEVVNKQADLIEYLKDHNALLSKRLLNLSAQ
ncbi:transmembrane protein 192 isoform X2 [Thalassophryne amazonica]|uniref:transmembrane protein 192 isoform X2 n=1 Tax=Thalassophryne amazonica TaxID=390379 RepID=UPI001471F3FA|nr:transmembrane protein 192 isoform X2 [Thalassophryne amazonica]